MARASAAAGRVALVTGGNRGIGLELVRQLLERGYRVVLASRDLARGQAAGRGLAPAERLAVAELDVAGRALEAQAARCERLFGGVDVLINNAAIHYDTHETASTADFAVVRAAFETNLFGAWRLALALVPSMRSRGWGRIVNVSSGAGAFRSIGRSTPAYSVSKAALNALTVSLADDLRGSGILVNAVCPGWVATDMGGPGGRPVAAGARSVLFAVELPDDGPTGGFFRDGRRIDW
ncbi:MAG TPA: SDR family NAD(P)-dependent oxidoreductase [Steroidobacteraceae bacterium]|nr:SDR family NAD(P)-dependent oxidoreductase [Steroidobacteraceae bacterium]